MNYNVLNVDKDDTSTNNLQRKLNKQLRRLKEKELNDEINAKIQDLEEKLNIFNPVKTNFQKNKKKEKPIIKKEYKSIIKKEYKPKKKRILNEKEIKKKNDMKIIKKKLEKIRDIQEKKDEKIRTERAQRREKRLKSKKLDHHEYKKLVFDNTNDQVMVEFNAPNIKYIKMTLILSLTNYKIFIPFDIVYHILYYLINQMKSINNVYNVIPKDIYDYSKMKYSDKNIENKLKLKYHPDKTFGKTSHTMVFISKIIETKKKYINYNEMNII